VVPVLNLRNPRAEKKPRLRLFAQNVVTRSLIQARKLNLKSAKSFSTLLSNSWLSLGKKSRNCAHFPLSELNVQNVETTPLTSGRCKREALTSHLLSSCAAQNVTIRSENTANLTVSRTELFRRLKFRKVVHIITCLKFSLPQALLK
jgi:hypothetical protein